MIGVFTFARMIDADTENYAPDAILSQEPEEKV